jgi:hypothetical protein
MTQGQGDAATEPSVRSLPYRVPGPIILTPSTFSPHPSAGDPFDSPSAAHYSPCAAGDPRAPKRLPHLPPAQDEPGEPARAVTVHVRPVLRNASVPGLECPAPPSAASKLTHPLLQGDLPSAAVRHPALRPPAAPPPDPAFPLRLDAAVQFFLGCTEANCGAVFDAVRARIAAAPRPEELEVIHLFLAHALQNPMACAVFVRSGIADALPAVRSLLPILELMIDVDPNCFSPSLATTVMKLFATDLAVVLNFAKRYATFFNQCKSPLPFLDALLKQAVLVDACGKQFVELFESLCSKFPVYRNARASACSRALHSLVCISVWPETINACYRFFAAYPTAVNDYNFAVVAKHLGSHPTSLAALTFLGSLKSISCDQKTGNAIVAGLRASENRIALMIANSLDGTQEQS